MGLGQAREGWRTLDMITTHRCTWRETWASPELEGDWVGTGLLNNGQGPILCLASLRHQKGHVWGSPGTTNRATAHTAYGCFRHSRGRGVPRRYLLAAAYTCVLE
jgi:hypothetical protein